MLLTDNVFAGNSYSCTLLNVKGISVLFL